MPSKTSQELAQEYGFAYSYLKSDPSLWKTFQRAVKGNWVPAKFIAELKSTTWYKKSSDQFKSYQLLRTSNPGEFAAQRSQIRAQLQDKAAALGATLSGATLSRVADNVMKFGWNDSQIQNTLADYVKAVHGVYHGAVGNDIETVQQTAYRNGVHLSKSTLAGWSHSIASGNNTAEFYQRYVRQMAKSLAPGYAKELDAGVDLQDIVSPYIQSKAKLLEMNPADLDLFDHDIRSAVSGVTKDGKPASQSLWQFEQKIRQSPAWLKTSNAQDGAMAVGHHVLQDMGFDV